VWLKIYPTEQNAICRHPYDLFYLNLAFVPETFYYNSENLKQIIFVFTKVK